MGVLRCSRNGCENIMCDHHSYEYGYICYDCLSELVQKGRDTNIEEFMESPKVTQLIHDDWKFFESIFTVWRPS